MLKNEIFYSLSKYEIRAIKEEITKKKASPYLNIIISFNQDEFNHIYKLLSNLYTIDNKEEVQSAIWETFICNKIIQELDKEELIYYSHNLEEEKNILKSFNLDLFLKKINNRSNLSILSQIIQNQISKAVIINYFQEDVIIPIELQKVINKIFISKLPFINILYTTRNSLNSYYMHNGYWTKQENKHIEVWKLLSYSNEKAN